jgi:hypothetical protein
MHPVDWVNPVIIVLDPEDVEIRAVGGQGDRVDAVTFAILVIDVGLVKVPGFVWQVGDLDRAGLAVVPTIDAQFRVDLESAVAPPGAGREVDGGAPPRVSCATTAVATSEISRLTYA